MRMLKELGRFPMATPLYLCTVPIAMPAELTVFNDPSPVRLKSVVPAKVLYRGPPQIAGTTTASSNIALPRVFLETSKLPENHTYSVSFTDQWTSTTYVVEGQIITPDRCGITFTVPTVMLRTEDVDGTPSHGLFDVHLLVDNQFRSENRRALAIVGTNDTSMSSNASNVSFEPVE